MPDEQIIDSPLAPLRTVPTSSRLLPLTVGIAALIFTFVVWWIMITHEDQQLERQMDALAISLRSHLEAGLDRELNSIVRMANRWEARGGTPRHE
ncbi:MAG: hypothetical protein O3A51_02770 [Verrucomicrobia bacterium]|nr:hypothetical protein [Verrucomicrobiota bacterium]